MESPLSLWIGFNVFVLLMLALDLGVFHRKSHVVAFKEAMLWSLAWITLAMVFNIGLYYWMGKQQALEFLTGYVIEKSLSVDNIFVFLMVFAYFKVQPKYQHRILFWGILGALLMRAGFIFAGIELLERFHWLIYVFGAFLIFTGIKMGIHHDSEIDPEKNPVIRIARKLIPMSTGDHGARMFVKEKGRWAATPMFLVLLVIETTDLIFAVDSIPAILAITRDPFIVYTSNVFAILGLRSLYFALAGVMDKFHLIHYALSAILVFVGVKMLIVDWYKIPIGLSLGFIGGTLAITIVASMIWPKKAQ